MKEHVNIATTDLTQLATGTLDIGRRQELVKAALTDPNAARELKLALRLAPESAALTRDWIAVAVRAPATQSLWRRPLVGVTASLAIAAAVMLIPRQVERPSEAPSMAIAHNDVIFRASDGAEHLAFEATSDRLSGGSFE